MASVTYEHVWKKFGDVVALQDLDIKIEDKEFLVLVGPSGCGKTTALRCLAGLEEATSGDIKIDDKVVNNIAPKDRDIAMVFQSYALYPHMTVYDNMAFGLKLRNTPKARDQATGRRSRPHHGHRRPVETKTPRTFRRSAPARGSRPRHRPRAQGFPL